MSNGILKNNLAFSIVPIVRLPRSHFTTRSLGFHPRASFRSCCSAPHRFGFGGRCAPVLFGTHIHRSYRVATVATTTPAPLYPPVSNLRSAQNAPLRFLHIRSGPAGDTCGFRSAFVAAAVRCCSLRLCSRFRFVGGSMSPWVPSSRFVVCPSCSGRCSGWVRSRRGFWSVWVCWVCSGGGFVPVGSVSSVSVSSVSVPLSSVGRRRFWSRVGSVVGLVLVFLPLVLLLVGFLLSVVGSGR